MAIAEGITTEPMWPDGLDIRKLLKLGFSDRIISNPEHLYVLQVPGLPE